VAEASRLQANLTEFHDGSTHAIALSSPQPSAVDDDLQSDVFFLGMVGFGAVRDSSWRYDRREISDIHH
jgi:hypothetical protein